MGLNNHWLPISHKFFEYKGIQNGFISLESNINVNSKINMAYVKQKYILILGFTLILLSNKINPFWIPLY